MSVPSLLEEPGRVDEPQVAQEYAAVLTRVVTAGPTRALQLGSVVWAELEDANDYRKVRPVVVASPTEDIPAGRSVRAVAITNRLPDPLP